MNNREISQHTYRGLTTHQNDTHQVKNLKMDQLNLTLLFRDEALVENRDRLIFCGIKNTRG